MSSVLLVNPGKGTTSMSLHYPISPLIRWLRVVIASGILLLCKTLPVSLAQIQTAITSDGTMGTVISQNGSLVDITGGTRPENGPNLFHSFGRFNVGTGDTARFSGPAGIENVISRVTGKEVSNIDGRLQSTIDGANMFLLNPSGIMFGPNATLDVQGSFHASTADALRFADGTILSAHLNAKSTLTVAPPIAFGFLGDSPAPITIERGTLSVSEGGTLSIIGGDIEIQGGKVQAPGGEIKLISSESQGEVGLHSSVTTSDLDSIPFERFGDVTITERSSINANGAGGGAVVIRGGRLLVNDGSRITASATGPLDSSSQRQPGQGIDIMTTEAVILDDATVESNVFSNVAETSADIRVETKHLDIRHTAHLISIALPGSTGSGDIQVKAQHLLIKDRSSIETRHFGHGKSGDINIRASQIKVQDGGDISTGVSGPGIGGDINIQAESIVVSSVGSAPGEVTRIVAYTLGKMPGRAGNIRVTTDRLEINGENVAEISSTTFGAGQGGNIEILAGRVSISGSSNPDVVNGIFTNTFDSGDGGHLSLQADSLLLTNRARITAGTFKPRDAGGATIQEGTFESGDAGGATIVITGNLQILNGARISTRSTAGQGGNIHINAASIHITNNGRIEAGTEGIGGAGSIIINLDQSLLLTNGGQLLSITSGMGSAGSIDVIANSVMLSGVNNVPIVDPDTGEKLVSPSAISTQAQSKGNAGDIQITAENLHVLDGARIDVRTLGMGKGGDINVVADRVVISGSSPVISEILGSSHAARSKIDASTDSALFGEHATGHAGNIHINAQEVQLLDGGLIGSATTTLGNGGSIDIRANRILLANDARIITVSEGQLNAGKAGDIAIAAQDELESDRSMISAAARDADSGSLTIKANRIQLKNEAVVSTRSFGKGNAKDIRIEVMDSFILSENSTVTTESSNADGGNILIKVATLAQMQDSDITASVLGGAETEGGNVLIEAPLFVMQSSNIRAQAVEGQGGNIRISSNGFVSDIDSLVTASSEKGVDGIVTVEPLTNLQGSLTPLPNTFTQEQELLHNRCAARLWKGAVSNFVQRGLEGLPVSPGGLLMPGLLTMDGPMKLPRKSQVQTRDGLPLSVDSGKWMVGESCRNKANIFGDSLRRN